MSKSRTQSKGTIRAAPIVPENAWTFTKTAQRIANWYDDVDLVINYPDDNGDYADTVLRLHISDDIMNAHMDWLRPALGERIRSVLVYDR